MSPKPGDLIEISRPGYQHWAIYIGDGNVVHLAQESEVPGAGSTSLNSITTDCAVVKKEPLWKVVGQDKYQINNKYDKRYTPRPVDEIIFRAKAKVGEKVTYNVISQNCEHFVTKLRYGIPVSDQVNDRIDLAETVMNVIPGIPGIAVGIMGIAALVFGRKH